MQGIVPHLWFDAEAEEAARFYTTVFPNSRINAITRYPMSAQAVSGKAPGSVMTVAFELNGQPFLALNGGPIFKFNESISLVVTCDTQEEIDRYWSSLSADPKAEQCGWLKDKFGVSWQIVPAGMEKFLQSDAGRSDRVMAAVLKMKKLVIKELQAAYDHA